MKNKSNIRKLLAVLFYFLLVAHLDSIAITRTSVSSGNWNNAACWNPAGIPSTEDDIIIGANTIINYNGNYTIRNINVNEAGKITGTSWKTLTINGNISVNGIFDMNGSDIICNRPSTVFSVGYRGTFIWNPATNLSSAATLFTNTTENFDAASTIVIKKWFDYTTPLSEYISGNFGNLTLNSRGGTSSIVEWDQQNSFESHHIKGTLTIDQGWITLDKSGAISNTTIGKIVLSSLNSIFIAHNGNHPSSFSLNTQSIENNGGKFYGINDGNGNISLRVFHDVNNSGNIKLINNSGIAGVSNGNAELIIDGSFIQSGGDTRLIYNIATTNSGNYHATIGSINQTGGIFMGQSGCHTGGLENSLSVIHDLNIHFMNASDKFRGNGITSIGSSVNNAGFNFHVGGNLIIAGTTQAEFTTSASSGKEIIVVEGNFISNGCTSSFNYGTIQGSHETSLLIKGNLAVNGGTICLSRNNGLLNGTIQNRLSITNGLLVIKGGQGSSDIIVQGKTTISGGELLLHSNINTPASNTVRFSSNGTFQATAGEIVFDDNAAGAEHEIMIQGDSFLLSGNTPIYSTLTSSSKSGLIIFNKPGIINYMHSGNRGIINGIKQIINPGCEVDLRNTIMPLASLNTPLSKSLYISGGAMLNCINSSLCNSSSGNCRIMIDSSATFGLTNQDGFSGRNSSALTSDVQYSINENGIIEYHGDKTQTISTLQNNNSSSDKYGIMKINMSDVNSGVKLEDNITVNKLNLKTGRLILNNYSINIENNAPAGIIRTKGFIESGTDINSTGNKISWKSVSAGTYCFPFGKSASEYIPVKITVPAGFGKDLTVSTCQTASDNQPYPEGSADVSDHSNIAIEGMVDRWWNIEANGLTAEIEFSFSKNELPENHKDRSFTINRWDKSSWTNSSVLQYNSSQNSVRIKTSLNKYTNSFCIIAKNKTTESINLYSAIKNGKDVVLKWTSFQSSAPTIFTIERSTDGINFITVQELNSAGFADDNYTYTDQDVDQPLAFYRISTPEKDSKSFSEIKKVSAENGKRSVEVRSVSPNPFISVVNIEYNSSGEDLIFQIIDSQGKVVSEEKGNNNSAGLGKKTLNLEDLKRGIYFLNIINGDARQIQKIIKN